MRTLSKALCSYKETYIHTDNVKFTEQIDKRTASSKAYLPESKRKEAVIFGMPVHYFYKNGQFKDMTIAIDGRGRSLAA